MHALLRKARLAHPGAAGDVARRVREGAVPILRAQPGFLLHLDFISEACEAIQAGLFGDGAAARAALQRLEAWTAASMGDLASGEEALGGPVLHHRGLAPGGTGGEEALFVTVREYSLVGPPEETEPLVNERILPMIERQPGFRGFWAFRDERDPGHAVSISLWSNRGAAFTAHGHVVEIMTALRDLFPNPPRIMAGAARVIAVPGPG